MRVLVTARYGSDAKLARAGRTPGDSDWSRELERRRAITWASALVADPRTLYLDTETTGLGATAEVVEIAVVGQGGDIVFETLVRPVGVIPVEVSAIHGIWDADVASAPSWSDIHDRLCGLLDGRPVVVYNAAFDRRLIGQSCDRHGLPAPNVSWECAMRAYAAFFGAAVPGRGGLRLQKLQVAAAAFGATTGGHRAAGDAIACRTIVTGMAANGAWPE